MDNIYSIDYVNFKRNAHSDIKFSPEMFGENSIKYNHDIARLCSQLTMIGYDLPNSNKPALEDCGLYKVLSTLGFGKLETHSETGRNEIDCSFSSMDTTVNGEQVRIIFVCLVGSRGGQWYENFDSGKGALHKGFERCENFVYENLVEYLSSVHKDSKRLKFLISGHSRGGATSDLLAARLIRDEKYAKAEDIFTYTFAAPSSYNGKERNEERFKRIFNIVNAEDFVIRCMPTEWGYGRYGITLVLPNKLNSGNFKKLLPQVNKFYALYTGGGTYRPFKKGTKPVDNLMKAFCKSAPDVNAYYDNKFKCFDEMLSVQEYFIRSLCAVTAEPENSKANNDGKQLLLNTFLKRTKCDRVFKTIADFFVIYEGLAGATGGKISDVYFSYGHDVCTYCAFMSAIEEKDYENPIS